MASVLCPSRTMMVLPLFVLHVSVRVVMERSAPTLLMSEQRPSSVDREVCLVIPPQTQNATLALWA